MSDSVRPHRRQPTRLPCPWDSQGKNTGVGCHFLLQCMKVKSESEVIQSCRTLVTPWTAAYQAPLSMGFSRQKYWSGVPLLSPVSGLVDLKSLPSLFLFHCVYYVCCVTSDASFPSSYGKKHEFIDPLCASFLLLCNKLP